MPRVAPPRKPKNADVRAREYLTESEVTRLAEAAQAHGRYGHRDACMIMLAFRHGLRVSELIALRWDMVDLDACLLHVTRLKQGVASSHPLRGPEVRGLHRVKRDAPQSPYVFVSEREAPMTDSNFRKLLARAGRAAGFEFLVHPHMLRHATGYKLANDGQDTRAIQHYLGHKNIQHTVRYTELNSTRFNKFWNDVPRVQEERVMESATIGQAAGAIWASLDAHGTVSLPQLQKGTHLSARLLAMGLGWLAREDTLVFVQDRPVLKLRLQDAPPA